MSDSIGVTCRSLGKTVDLQLNRSHCGTQSADVPSNSSPIAVQDTVTFATTVYSKRLLLH